MSRAYREHTETKTTVSVSSVMCDRCGESARVVGAPGDRVAWAEFQAVQQGSADLIAMDLCRQCGDEVLSFITQHPRATVRRLSDVVREMSQTGGYPMSRPLPNEMQSVRPPMGTGRPFHAGPES